MTNQKLECARAIVAQLLNSFLTDVDFVVKLNLALGNDFDVELARDLIKGLIARDMYPEVEIIAASEINGANGAFAGSLNKVFLAQEFVDSYDADDIAFLLLEELGHYLDWQLNEDDTGGDEGAVFSALVRGESLTQNELQQLQNEDDWATVSIGGVEIAIEQQRVTGSSENDILNVQVSGFAGDVIRVDLRTALTPEQRTQNPSFSFGEGTIAGVAVANNEIISDGGTLTFAETGVFYFVPEIRFDAHPPELTDNDETNDNINSVNFQETAFGTFRIDFDNGDFELGNLNINIEAGYSPFSLSGSVGEDREGEDGENVEAENNRLDIYRVEQRLRYLGFPSFGDDRFRDNNEQWQYPLGESLDVNGILEATQEGRTTTSEAIRLFQSTYFNADGQPQTWTNSRGEIINQTSNGRVEVDGNSHQWLNATNAPRWVELIDNGNNFNISRQPPRDAQWERFGTDWTRDIIIEATGNVGNTQVITGISEYGWTDLHGTHKDGKDIDVRFGDNAEDYTSLNTAPGVNLTAQPEEDIQAPRDYYLNQLDTLAADNTINPLEPMLKKFGKLLDKQYTTKWR